MKLFFLMKGSRELAGAPFFCQEVPVYTKAPEPGGAGSGYKRGREGRVEVGFSCWAIGPKSRLLFGSFIAALWLFRNISIVLNQVIFH